MTPKANVSLWVSFQRRNAFLPGRKPTQSQFDGVLNKVYYNNIQ